MSNLPGSIRSSLRRELRLCRHRNVETAALLPLRRSLATVSTDSPSSSSSAASSSSSSSSVQGKSWQPPIAPGVEPAYDEALAFLSQHQTETRREMEEIKKRLAGSGTKAEEKEALEKTLEELEIVAEVNDPATRWEFAAGKVDMSRPVHRYLREQAWRRPSTITSSRAPSRSEYSRADAGPLEKLIERCRLMKVVPDVVPFATPTVDLQVYFGEGAGFGDHGGQGGEVLAGVFLNALVTKQAPRVEATPFHVDERKYTLLLVDPDSPNIAQGTFKTYAHWLIEDVPLRATRTSISAQNGKEVLSFIPPHPQQGTPYHRYVMVLLTEGPTQEGGAAGQASTAAQASKQPRDDFDVTAYMEQRKLQVAGIHFWRETWEEGTTAQAVSQVYESILRQPEPAYGEAPTARVVLNELGEKPSKYM